AHLRQQARKSASSCALNTAEGAARQTLADKSRAYAIALTECCEVCAAVEIAGALNACTAGDVLVRGLSECTQSLGHSLVKIVGEPLVAFEQIEVRLTCVIYGPRQDLDLITSHGFRVWRTFGRALLRPERPWPYPPSILLGDEGSPSAKPLPHQHRG